MSDQDKTTAIVIIILSLLVSILFVAFGVANLLPVPVLFGLLATGYWFKKTQEKKERERKAMERAAEVQREWELKEPERLREQKEKSEREERQKLWGPDADKIVNLLATIQNLRDEIHNNQEAISEYIDWVSDPKPEGTHDYHVAITLKTQEISTRENEIHEIGENLYTRGGLVFLREVVNYVSMFSLRNYWKNIDPEFDIETKEMVDKKKGQKSVR